MEQQSAKQSKSAGNGAGTRCETTWALRLALLTTALVALLGGCSTPSVERVESVRQSLEQARERQADRYLPEVFAAAEERVERLELEVEKQAARTFWSWRPGAGRGLLASAEEEVEELRAATDRAVLAAQKKAEAALEEARVAVDRAAAAYWGAPRGKDTRAEILRMRSDLEGVEGELTAVRMVLEQGDFLLVLHDAEDLARRAELLSRTIDRAMAHRLSLLAASTVNPRDVVPAVLASPEQPQETRPPRVIRR